MEALGRPEGVLVDRLAAELARMSGIEIGPDDFKQDKLARHQKILVRIIGRGGRVLGQSRDVQKLVERFSERARSEVMARQAGQWPRVGLGPGAGGQVADDCAALGRRSAYASRA